MRPAGMYARFRKLHRVVSRRVWRRGSSNRRQAFILYVFGNMFGSENGVPPRIIRKELNGQNESVLLELSSGEALLRPFVSDEQFFYCLRKTYKTMEGGVNEYYDLISINKSNGQIHSLYQWDYTHIVSLQGIVNNSLVCLDISAGAKLTDISDVTLPPLTYTFVSIAPTTGASSELWSWGAQEAIKGYGNGRMFSDSYFYYDTENHAVMRHNFATGQTTEITRDVPDLSIINGGAPFDCFIDDTLYIKNGVDFYAAISMQDMSITEKSLFYQEDDKTKPVRIIDEAGDNYLVVAGAENIVVHGYDKEGIPIEFPSTVDKLALISKTDYRANQPNFTWLQRS